jgi:peptide/nickel transport system permease protein
MATYKEKEKKSGLQKIADGLRLVFGFGMAVLLMVMFLLSTFGLTPHNPERPEDLWIAEAYLPPFESAQYPLGTDLLGRDILSRLIAGAKPYFLPGLTAVLISLGLGVFWGTVAGFYGGWRKDAVALLVSVIEAFPRLILFLLVMAILKIDIWVIMGLLGLFNAPKIATLVEGKVHALKQTDFIEAARALGLQNRRIIWYHIIVKNCFALLLVQATYGLADAILVETSLSYLGFGVQEPYASWGNMVLAGKSVFFQGKFWVSSIPAVMIMLAILGLHQAGDSLNRMLGA